MSVSYILLVKISTNHWNNTPIHQPQTPPDPTLMNPGSRAKDGHHAWIKLILRVDGGNGGNPAKQLRLGIHPIIFQVLFSVHPRWCRSCFINSRARQVHHLCFCTDVCDMGNVYIRRHNVCSAHSVPFTQKKCITAPQHTSNTFCNRNLCISYL